ncbi:hypothetical protein [Natrinema halophilum]|uniref:Rpa-associated protein n=1 Tax=Natrinema halophilum TaxID=1699371 RepID=A0A7D5KJT7_9EURY|nr:hypothetical protein [Natrinema halophilum]QLG48458.1 hypothetical protein HYG82_06150 [Natrinema halophilum]
MSANENENSDEEIPGREIAYRLFATEYDDASLSYAESDEERAPNYVISPTGARLNRVFAVGTLTEVTSVNDEMVRARLVDPTGAFVVYAGQYQPDELAFLEQAEPPAFVAVTGKARTFQPEDSDRVYTSIRPESIATVDADTRDRWVVSAAEQTLERIGTYAAAAQSDASGDALTDALLEAGVEPGFAAGIPLAQDHYATTPSYLAALRACALEACEVVAGQRDQVNGFDVSPGDTSPEHEATVASLTDLTDVDLAALEASVDPESGAAETEPVAATASGDTQAASAEAHSGSAAGTATSSESGSTTADTDPVTDPTSTEPSTGSAEGTAAEPTADVDETPPAEGSDPEPGSPTADADPESTAADPESTDADPESTAADPESTDADPESTAADPESITADSVSADADSEIPEPEVGSTSDADDEQIAVDGADDGDELGDFDAGAADDGMYEMDDEEREQLEEEFGAEFTTGSEVDDPGAADIDAFDSDEPVNDDLDAPSDSGPVNAEADEPTGPDESEPIEDEAEKPGSIEDADSAAEADPAGDVGTETDGDVGTETDGDVGTETDDEPGDDEPAAVDLESYVVETMAELDDGSGADRGEVIETVAADTGASTDEVEDAIQDALMGGQCYEPDDETLKAI